MSDYPKIDGHRYSFASVEVTMNGVPIGGIKSVVAPAPLVHLDPFSWTGQTTGRLISRAEWRVWKRKNRRNRTRSSARTDFGRRFA